MAWGLIGLVIGTVLAATTLHHAAEPMAAREEVCAPVASAVGGYAIRLSTAQAATPAGPRRTIDRSGSRECFDDVFCLEGIRDGDIVEMWARSLTYAGITLQMSMEFENLSTTRSMPLVFPLPARGRTRPLSLRLLDTEAAWSYRLDVRWTWGRVGAEHDDRSTYRLPVGPGVSVLVGQGYHGELSHEERFAIDFDLPEGTRVMAARGGVVVETEDQFTRGGVDPDLTLAANYVQVEHGDGTLASYVHLRHRGVRVRPGQVVVPGQLLGYSGNTGYSSGPHLHFEVYRLTEDLNRGTLPVHFSTARGRVELREGETYSHPGRR